MLWKGLVLVAFAVGTLAVPAPTSEIDVESFFIKTNENRIVGGQEAPEGSVPWAVSLTSGSLIRSHFCGASLVTQRHIVTAAHCIAHVHSRLTGLTSSLRAIVGSNRWNLGGTQYAIKSNFTHPNYLAGIIKNDIGVFLTKVVVNLTPSVQPTKLSFEDIEDGVEARITGWGVVKLNGKQSTVLLELYTKVLGADKCTSDVKQKATELNIKAPDVEGHIEICTYHSADHGNCHGDSGGALVRTSDNAQIGVVSWGLPCAVGAPDMYARVSSFQDFFEKSLNSS